MVYGVDDGEYYGLNRFSWSILHRLKGQPYKLYCITMSRQSHVKAVKVLSKQLYSS